MKRVVRKIKDEEIFIINFINDSCHVGIQLGLTGSRCKVVKLGKERFTNMWWDDDDVSNNWSRNSKQQVVESSLDQNNLNQAFVFDTNKELHDWLLNK